MRRWLLGISVLLSSLAASCLWHPDTPELLSPPEGLKVEEDAA